MICRCLLSPYSEPQEDGEITLHHPIPPPHTHPTSKEGKTRSRAPTGTSTWWWPQSTALYLAKLKSTLLTTLAQMPKSTHSSWNPSIRSWSAALVFHRWKWTSPLILAENLPLHIGFIVVFIGGARKGRDRRCVCTCVLGEREGKRERGREGGRGRGEKTSELLKSRRRWWDVNIWLTERLNRKRKHTTIHFLTAREAPTVTAKRSGYFF